MNYQEQKLEELKQMVKTLEPYEVIEIKLENNERGKVSITRKSTDKQVVDMRE